MYSIEIFIVNIVILAIALSVWLGTSETSTKAVTYKSHDGTYVCGVNKGNIDFYSVNSSVSSISFNDTDGSDNYDSFLAKYNSDGKVLWAAKQTGTAGFDVSSGVSTDRNGNIYVSGYYLTNLDLYSKNSTTSSVQLSGSGYGGFIAKYDSNGNVLWAAKQSGTGTEISYDVSTDRYGNVYIAGDYNQNLDLYSKNSTTSSVQLSAIVSGYNTGFIAKYDKDGNVKWAAKQGSTPPAGANLKSLKISTDRNGNVYIAGEFNGNITFYKEDNTPGISFTGSTVDGFLAKYDSNGNVLWAAKQSGTGTEISYDVSTDRYGNVYIGGDYYTNTPITLYNSDDSTGVTLSNDGDDSFIAKYDSNGNVLWAAKQSGSGTDSVVQGVSSYYYLEEVQ